MCRFTGHAAEAVKVLVHSAKVYFPVSDHFFSNKSLRELRLIHYDS